MKNVLGALVLALVAMPAVAQTTLVAWNFDDSNTVPDAGVKAGSSSASRGGGLTVPGTGEYPAGNPGQSWSSASWTADPAIDATDYHQFTTSTAGFADIQFGFEERRSSTGPASFSVQYSLNGSDWSLINTGTSNTAFTSHGYDLSGYTDLNDKATVHFRVYGYGSGGAAGTWRFDNVFVSAATALPVELQRVEVH